MKCPDCGSEFIVNGRCGVCDAKIPGMKQGPEVVKKPVPSTSEGSQVSKLFNLVSIDKKIEKMGESQPKELEAPLTYTTLKLQLPKEMIRQMISAVQLAPKNPPGRKLPKEQKVVKINLSIPRDLYDSLKNEPGKLSEHVERGMRFYLSIMKV